MSDYVLFQMWGPFRQSLIDGHRFYVEQARKRLLSQFDNIDADADKAADEWLKNNSHRFDPERHDPAAFDEAAYEFSIEFYQLLSDMREQTRLSVVAGMFHEWDKQLRDWLTREIGHWHYGTELAGKVWKVNFVEIAELLDALGWKFTSGTFYPKLDACRLVVNVYKHGEGGALNTLKQRFPEYLDNPLGLAGHTFSSIDFIDHTSLKVSETQIQEISDAIEAFWNSIPENTFESQVTDLPGWFEKSFLHDHAAQQERGAK